MAHGRRATPSIVPRFYLTRRQPWHASSASRTCCCATFHTRPSSARAALADPSRTASERELATDSRTALANHVAIPVLLTQPHIEAGQSQVDGVEAVSKHPGPSPCSPRRRRWLAPPPSFPTYPPPQSQRARTIARRLERLLHRTSS